MNTDTTNVEKIASAAAGYFGNGLHCAEAIVKACADNIDEIKDEHICLATPFGGGVGKSFDEMCGALSGGLLVIGSILGRTEPDQNWDLPAAIANKLRESFLQHSTTTHCGVLREQFGEEEQIDKCRIVVLETTIDLLNLLQEIKEKNDE